MGVLRGQNLHVESFNHFKHHSKVLKQNAILQISKFLQLFGQHKKDYKEAQKYGTEVEVFILKKKIYKN